MRITVLFIFIVFCITSSGQTNWKSKKYGYSIEIPFGFYVSESIGTNVDFKANKGKNSIVIVIKTIPVQFQNYTIWEFLGDIRTFGGEWEIGAREYLNNPKFIKYGKTTVNNIEAFWYDHTTENPKTYFKTYQLKKGNLLYTFTLTCEYNNYNEYSATWYRFKDKIRLN